MSLGHEAVSNKLVRRCPDERLRGVPEQLQLTELALQVNSSADAVWSVYFAWFQVAVEVAGSCTETRNHVTVH